MAGWSLEKVLKASQAQVEVQVRWYRAAAEMWRLRRQKRSKDRCGGLPLDLVAFQVALLAAFLVALQVAGCIAGCVGVIPLVSLCCQVFVWGLRWCG